jgi:hypothetical protein
MKWTLREKRKWLGKKVLIFEAHFPGKPVSREIPNKACAAGGLLLSQEMAGWE